MRVVLLGAGLQAQAACHDLVRQPDLTEITVADSDPDRAEALARRWGDRRVRPVRLDAADPGAAARVLEGARAALSAVPYRFNAGLARAAVRVGCSFCDLGGNNAVVAEELALDTAAREAGVTVVPDCGLAPGMVAVLTAHAVASFDETEAVEIRVGGIPQKRGGILDYSLLFNIQGLINEYVEDAVVLEEGEIRTVPCPGSFEELEFPEPFGRMEAFSTSGGTSTLPETYRGRVERLNYKTIRYPGHGRVILVMKELGLLSWDPVDVDGVRVAPRAVFAKVAEPVLDRGEPDVILMRVTASGLRGGGHASRVYEMIEYPDAESGLTAMMRTTAYPATVVLMMLARGEVAVKGALPQERCIDPERFLEELRARGLRVTVTDS
jgi:lysine 6-dehydrogenase